MVWEIGWGLFALLAGGDLLVRGAAALARRLRISELAIGLILVGFGTSVPELVTCLDAAWRNAPGIVIGNVIGSNIANILLVLGAAALVRPMQIEAEAFRRDGMALVIATACGLIAAWLHELTVEEGLIFLALLCAYTIGTYRAEKRAEGIRAQVHIDRASLTELKADNLAYCIALFVGGTAFIIVGAADFVDGCIELARTFEIPETVIGLTVVAVGTSLPELATGMIAAFRGRSELAVGNVLGSNMFNVLGILGTTALVSPMQIPAFTSALDLGMFAASAVVLSAIALANRTIGRGLGAVFLLVWMVYVTVLAPGWR
jgi:cation:H+ antiporter